MSDADTTPGAGLGLPVKKRAGAIVTDTETPFIKYELPKRMVGLRWESYGFTDADLTFKMIEITPLAQDRAAKVSSGNASKLGKELMFAALYRVGGWSPQRNNRDRLEQWWTAIGSKGRRLVEAAFMKMQSVEETDVENFLDSGVASGSD